MHLNQHLDDVGETYGEHFGHAAGYGVELMTAGVACLIHAILPFLFERTASNCVQRLHARMAARGRVSLPSAVGYKA